MQLDGKVALVTGAGRNIGRAIALGLGAEGATVVVNARSNRKEAEAVAQEITAAGGQACAMLADVGDRGALEGMLDGILREFGHIDIVINNAAYRPSTTPLVEMTYEQWREVLATDLEAAFITSKAAAPGMIERGWGRIINFSGLVAFQGWPSGVHISTAKVGMIGLTRSLSAELAHAGILSNCIVPGVFDTSPHYVGPNAQLPPPADPAEAARREANIAATIPVGRRGTSEEIASLCTYLCTDGAAFITGQTFHVNGGARVY